MRIADNQLGGISVLAAYTIWGSSAILWNYLSFLDSFEIVLQRIIWSVPILVLFLFFSKSFHKIKQLNKKNICLLLITSVLIILNWLIFVWAVKNGKAIEASLGYFILPLLNVTLGVLFFKEKLNKLQYFALLIVLFATLLLFFANEKPPWVAISLALLFSIYSALRKQMTVGATIGLSFEILMLLPFAIISLIFLYLNGEINFGFFSKTRDLIVPMTGFYTAIPLLLSIFGTRKILFSTSGILFYWNPVLQFLIGFFVLKEQISNIMIVSFILIWIATVIYFMSNNKKLKTTKIEIGVPS